MMNLNQLESIKYVIVAIRIECTIELMFYVLFILYTYKQYINFELYIYN